MLRIFLGNQQKEIQMQEESNEKKQLIVIGSARVDAFLSLPEDRANRHCDLDDKKCVIELSYASKIPLQAVEFLVGGNGANVAVGTKRLGINSVLIAEVGTGPMGDHTMDELKKEIDVSLVSQQDGVPAGFGAVIVYQGERTILSYYPPVTPKFPADTCGAEWAYLTSTGERFADYYEDVYKWLKSCNPKLAFNPGGRQIKKGAQWLKKYLEATELLILNREEGEAIADLSGTFGKEKVLIDALREFGPRMVVVTDGTNGSFAFDGEKYVHCGILPIDGVERTGAGDASSAAMLASLIQGKSMGEALLRATINSASVIGYFGPQPGLLREDQMPEWIERARSCEVKVEEF